MKRLKIYIETSVWNFLIAYDSQEKREITEKLFEELDEGKYEVFISNFVLDEITRAGVERRGKLEDCIKKFNPVILRANEEFEVLAEKYLRSNFIPEKFKADIFHIAIASVYELDVIVSWNLRHIVKLKTKRYANSINMAEGYKEIEIVTPEEVIEYD